VQVAEQWYLHTTNSDKDTDNKVTPQSSFKRLYMISIATDVVTYFADAVLRGWTEDSRYGELHAIDNL
jgi:hypothetical protein